MPVLIGLIQIESTGAVCGFLSLCWNLLRYLKHMAKRKMAYQEEFYKAQTFLIVICSFLNAIYLGDCVEKLAMLKQRYCMQSLCYG